VAYFPGKVVIAPDLVVSVRHIKYAVKTATTDGAYPPLEE